MLSGILHYWELARVEIRPWIWSLFLLLYVAAISPSQSLTLFILAFVSFQALKEYFSIIPMRQNERPLLILGYVSIPLQFICIATHNYTLALGFTPLYILLLSIFGLQKYGATQQMFSSILKIGWGVFTLVYLISYIGLLLWWPVRVDLAGSGVSLLLFFLIMVHFQSAAQFLLTRWGIHEWPRHILNSQVWGFNRVASILSTGVVAWSIGPRFTWLAPQAAMLAGLAVGLAACMGTITIRSLQQALYITDEEHLLPGMGGILNLIYPFVYAAPLLFFLLLLLHR